MALESIKSVTGTAHSSSSQTPAEQQHKPAPAPAPLPDKDKAVINTETKGDTRLVPLPPGQKPSTIQKVESGAYEALAHIMNKIKMVLVFPTLDPDREIMGYAVAADKIGATDGDFNVEIVPVAQDRDVMYYRGAYRAMAPDNDNKSKFIPPQGRTAARRGVIEVEADEESQHDNPQMKKVIDDIKRLTSAGKTPLLKLHGQWTYDPMHDGWVEIHPVKGIEIVDPEAVPPASPLPPANSPLWADSHPRFRVSGFQQDYTLRVGGTMGNGGGLSIGTSKDILTFGTKPGYTPNKDGEIGGFHLGIRGTLAPELTGILAQNGNSQLRVGGAFGLEFGTWGNAWRIEGVGGQAFARDSSHTGPYVGGRLSYSLNIGPAGSRMGAFVQVDKTIADQGPVTGTVGLAFSF